MSVLFRQMTIHSILCRKVNMNSVFSHILEVLYPFFWIFINLSKTMLQVNAA